MNPQLRTILLTVASLSLFVIALVELSGVSRTALINRFSGEEAHVHDHAEGPGKNPNARPDMPKTRISFPETKHSFGTITEGEKVRHAYKFRNVGEHPLVITNAVASCGCTVPSYSKEPIPPGGEGEIVVAFNSSGRPGRQQKNVLVYSNAEPEAISIGFDADVKEK
ncbi:MAG TPA: DUF1573 domain-containing protein [Chitinophagaceae bacterium]|nr:DUF1573 domain-containing protein [Chitinophagaceae bacterium]